MRVDAHPCEQGVYFLVLVDDVAGIYGGGMPLETDGLVVGNAISETVHLVEFIEEKRWIVLHSGRRTWFVREHSQKTLPCGTILRGRKHILPHAKFQFSNHF